MRRRRREKEGKGESIIIKSGNRNLKRVKKIYCKNKS